LAALHQAFPGVVLDEAWQTKDQLTITVKVNYLPEVVEFLYYHITAGWGKISGYAGTQQYMEAMGVPGFLLPLTILLEFGGGLAI
ncbi:DoxX family membrane protein, partial [Salmonella enterica subsp. enterica serovar Anatum]|nr:DoxX family membrane protein [Salmonella enterica subsp. enterica serovar Anatum]